MKRLKTYLEFIKVRGTRFALVAVLSVAGLASVSSAGVAHAAGRTEFCINGNECLNAWNTGPAVDVYSPGVANDNFTLVNSSTSGYVNIKFVGNGLCVGDYGNSNSDARAGLVSGCGTSSIGWGGNFQAISCNGGNGLEFKNAHWPGGYLGPQFNSNGSSFFLNKPGPYCFNVITY